MIHAFVPGTAVPQGSVDVYRGRIVGVKAPLKKWRADVRAATLARHSGEPLDGPLTVSLVFQIAPPQRPRWWAPAVKEPEDESHRPGRHYRRRPHRLHHRHQDLPRQPRRDDHHHPGPEPQGETMTSNDQTRAAINEGILDLVKLSGENSRDHGFHEDWPREGYPIVTATGKPASDVPQEWIDEHKRQVSLAITQKLMLIVEELIESFGEIRDGRDPLEIYYLDKAGLVGPKGAHHQLQAYGHFVNGELAAYVFGEPHGDLTTPLLKPEGFIVEIADMFIRGADLTYLLEGKDAMLDALRIKHEYNATRPYKHGRKF